MKLDLDFDKDYFRKSGNESEKSGKSTLNFFLNFLLYSKEDSQKIKHLRKSPWKVYRPPALIPNFLVKIFGYSLTTTTTTTKITNNSYLYVHLFWRVCYSRKDCLYSKIFVFYLSQVDQLVPYPSVINLVVKIWKIYIWGSIKIYLDT